MLPAPLGWTHGPRAHAQHRHRGAHLCLFFYCYGAHLDLHSFPTRRSSDLPVERGLFGHPTVINNVETLVDVLAILEHGRSEEHTSELQSRFDLVYRLLL